MDPSREEETEIFGKRICIANIMERPFMGREWGMYQNQAPELQKPEKSALKENPCSSGASNLRKGRSHGSPFKRPVNVSRREKSYICNVCGKAYSSRKCFIVHVKTHKLDELSKQIRALIQEEHGTCKDCGKKFDLQRDLIEHVREHTRHYRYGKEFISKETLDVQNKTYANLTPFSCPLCEERFSYGKSFQYHLNSNHKGESFCCKICGKTVQKTKLLKHVRMHAGEKPFACNLCGEGFSRKHNLLRHTLTHSREKPYSCDVCGHSYARKYIFEKHSCKFWKKV